MNKTRYRIGTTSFIYRGSYLENVEKLGPYVDDIEILFFDLSRTEDIPGSGEIDKLVELKNRFDLTYTVHTPLDVRLGDENESLRRSSVEKIKKTVKLAHALAPLAYTVHADPGDLFLGDNPGKTVEWLERTEESLTEIIESGLPSRNLSVETLDKGFPHLDPILERLDLSVTLDLGHVQRDKGPQEKILSRYLSRSRIIQIHGTEPGGRDHKSLRHYPEHELDALLRKLDASDFDGVVTLEVFDVNDFEESLSIIESRRKMIR